jgi:excisionase family DNA binding protein
MNFETSPDTPLDLTGRLTLSVEEAGSLLRIGRSAAYDAVHRGEIPHVRIGRRYLVPVPRLPAMLGNDMARNRGRCRTSPSDSPWKAPVSGFGIDTVRLRGPATPDLLVLLPEKRFTTMYDDDTGEVTEAQRSGYTAVRVGETFVRVKAGLRTGSPEVAFEFSAPSVIAGHNQSPLPVDLLPEVIDVVFDGLRGELTGLPRRSELRLLRLDIDRDVVGVRSIPSTLWSIAQRPVVRAETNTLHGAGQRWQSLTRGNAGSWLAVGYGKGEQLAAAAADTYEPSRRGLLLDLAEASYGTLRWEFQARREMLRQHQELQIDNLDGRTVYRMAETYFDRTRFADPLGSDARKVEEAMSTLSSAERRGVLALLAADLVGLPAPMSHGPEDNYRALVRRLRLAPDDLLGQAGERRRLDFTAGREIADCGLTPPFRGASTGSAAPATPGWLSPDERHLRSRCSVNEH